MFTDDVNPSRQIRLSGRVITVTSPVYSATPKRSPPHGPHVFNSSAIAHYILSDYGTHFTLYNERITYKLPLIRV
jgi:hypothetical protein